ncbi:MAG: ACT domain-containing protein [Pseudomonadota bacterium]
MIAQMTPEVVPGGVAFVTLNSVDASALVPVARAMVREAEGITLILPANHAAVPEHAMRMVQITLQVHSALDGLGLTAAVADALAHVGVPCNVVAGFHHDHVFVPETEADRALSALRARSEAQQ